jgi:hypothetical protein
MKFCQTVVPEKLFDLARERMRKDSTFTPGDIQKHILIKAKDELAAITFSEINWRIIANRVTRACINELRDAGEIQQFKHGRWAMSSFMEAIKD